MDKLKTLWTAYRWYLVAALILLIAGYIYFQFFGKASVEKGNQSLDIHYSSLGALSNYKEAVEAEYNNQLFAQLQEQQSLYADSAEWQMSDVMKRRWEMVQSKFTTNGQTNFFKKVVQRMKSDKTKQGLEEAGLRIRNAQDYSGKFALRMPVKKQLINTRALSLIDLAKRIDSLEALIEVEAKTIMDITTSYKSTGMPGGEMANVRRAKQLVDVCLKNIADPILRTQFTLDTTKAASASLLASQQTALAEFDNSDAMLKNNLNAIVPDWAPIQNTMTALRSNAEVLYRTNYRSKLYTQVYLPVWTKECARLHAEEKFWLSLSELVSKL
jgi:hypothetical protein